MSMATTHGKLSRFEFTYFLAKPRASPFGTIQELEDWRRFLTDLILAVCRNDPVAILYGQPDWLPAWRWGGRELELRAASGKRYRLHEVPYLSREIVQEEIIGVEQFVQTSDLLLWKPKGPVEHLYGQGILDWRDGMFQQAVPFSQMICTQERLGFPGNDGEWFYWLNPDMPLSQLASVAESHGVELETPGLLTEKGTP
jgi:hypothetical protein